jgi:hypothetical protein
LHGWKSSDLVVFCRLGGRHCPEAKLQVAVHKYRPLPPPCCSTLRPASRRLPDYIFQLGVAKIARHFSM